jgi:anti-sigma B factor antagonist
VYCAAVPRMSTLELNTEQQGGQTTVVLMGELDIASTDSLEEELAKIEADPPAILVLDLRGVQFIDSTGLRAVIAADERARSAGRRFVIVRGTHAVERLFSVTQLDRRLEIVDSPDSID